RLSGCTETPSAARAVSVGDLKSYPPRVASVLLPPGDRVRVRVRLSGLKSKTRASGGSASEYSTRAAFVTLSLMGGRSPLRGEERRGGAEPLTEPPPPPSPARAPTPPPRAGEGATARKATTKARR